MSFVDPERLTTCVHCGLCLAACPTYLELGTEMDSPRGRIHLMRGLNTGAVAPNAEVIRHLDLCLACRACETACPSGVPYGELIEAARPYLESHRPAPARWWRRMLGTALTTRGFGRLVLAPLARIGAARGLRWLPGAWTAWARALPRGRVPALPRVLVPAGPARGTAVLLTGCVADALFPATNRATALLLQRAGVRVVVPDGQGCCGALALHLGLADRARRLARRSAAALDVPDADWVVSNAAGCGALLRDYEHLLPEDAHAGTVARRARDASELLAELRPPAASRALDRTIAVHDPCHLVHGQAVRGAVRELMATIPGVRLVELEESDTCCGSAGTYNLTEPGMARRLLARKLDRIERSGADVVVAANPGCLLQIRAGALARRLPVAVEHPIDVLARAHGLVS